MGRQFSLANLFAWMTLAAVGSAMVYWFGERGACVFAVATFVSITLRIALERANALLRSALVVFLSGFTSGLCAEPTRTYFDTHSPGHLLLAGCLVGIVSQFLALPSFWQPDGKLEEDEPPSFAVLAGTAAFLVLVGFVSGLGYNWLNVRGEPRPEQYFWTQFPQYAGLGLLGGAVVAAAYLVAMVRKP